MPAAPETAIPEMRRDPRAEVSVVIPVHNGAGFLRRTLPALARSTARPRVLVVDDASSDDTFEVARALGAEVLRLPQKVGPAEARNRGARTTDSEVVLFLDADCVPGPQVVEKVASAFREDSDLVALSGSYEAEAGHTGFFSQYMNLRHHFFHQRARQEDATFWSGCGAVRREAFLSCRGFDTERYTKPQIEDIELGKRLRALGKTRLDPDLQVTHLKRWSLYSVVKTDVRDRGVPWSRLILESGDLPDDLNLQRSQRFAALLSPLSMIALLALPWTLATQRWDLALAAVLTVVLAVVLNAGMVRTFARQHGLRFAVGAGLFHQLHLIYSSATLLSCAVEHLASVSRPGAPGSREAFLAENPRLVRLLRSAFARYDPIALGVAIGTLAGLGLFLATAILLVRGGDPVGPNLSLLVHFLTGYTVTWPGAFLGLVEAGLLGFGFGWCLAVALNGLIWWHQSVLLRQLRALRGGSLTR